MTIKQYLNALKKMDSQRSGYYNWLLKKGKSFKAPGKLTSQEKTFVKQYRHSNKAKQCYYNSQMLNLNNSKFQYYEGWYLWEDIGFPLEHGFNVLRKKVVDTTQFNQNKKRKRSFFGVHIPKSFLRKNISETGMAQSVLYKYYRYAYKQ